VAYRSLVVGDWDIEVRAFDTPDGSLAVVTFQ
jgi:hypothetical protein